jgi:hypothetical protein
LLRMVHEYCITARCASTSGKLIAIGMGRAVQEVKGRVRFESPALEFLGYSRRRRIKTYSTPLCRQRLLHLTPPPPRSRRTKLRPSVAAGETNNSNIYLPDSRF